MNINKKLKLPCGYVVKNRIAKAACTEHLAENNGNPNEKHFKLYSVWKGLGLNLTGNIMLDRENLEGEGNIIIDEKTPFDLVKKWANSGENLWLQIGHAGAQSLSKKALSPSGIQIKSRNRSFTKPIPMTLEEIENLKSRYCYVSKLAKEAGFKGIQIHSAHGYLLNQFLSPNLNIREDKYGGSLENRMRLLLEIIQEVRIEVGNEYPISVKMNSSDGNSRRLTEEDRIKICLELEKVGVDLIEISGGSAIKPLMKGIEREVNTFAPFAYKLREKGLKCPLMLTGGIRDVNTMNKLIEEGIVDIIGLGRPLLANPNLGVELLNGKIEHIEKSEGDLIEDTYQHLNWYWERMKSYV